MTDTIKIAVRIPHHIRVLKSENAKLAVLEIKTQNGNDHYPLTREGLEQLAELLLKNATRFEYSAEKKSS